MNSRGPTRGLDVFSMENPGEIHRVKRALNKAYINTATKGTVLYGMNDYSQGIDIVDLSNPLSPSIIGTLPSGPLSGIGVSEDNNYLLVGLPEEQQVYIYGLTNPLSPELLGTLMVAGPISEPTSVTLKQGILAIDSGYDGVYFYSFASPTDMTFVGSYNYASDSGDEFLGFHNGYALFGESSDAKIDVRRISDLSVSLHTSPSFSTEHEPRLMGNYLYTVGRRSNTNEPADLYIWDLSTLPSIPGPVIRAASVPSQITLGYWSRNDANQYVVWDYLVGRACIMDTSVPLEPKYTESFAFSYRYA